jgi:hypothetical protein
MEMLPVGEVSGKPPDIGGGRRNEMGTTHVYT